MELEQYRKSGLRIEEYAAANGMSVSTLRWWGGQLGTGTKRGVKTNAPPLKDRAFIPLRAVVVPKDAPRVQTPQPAAPQAGFLEVGLRNGRVVRIGFDADPRAIARLVSALEETAQC